MLYFITGNQNKFKEAKNILADLEQLDIDLPEIQSIDPKEIIEAKLKEALHHQRGEFIVEDTSLYLDCLNGLPGPLIKWFLKSIGVEGIFKLADQAKNYKATAKAVIGYAKTETEICFFEGVVDGEIVSPKGESKFGWDPIFKPLNFSKTFAEMSTEEKNKIYDR